MVKYAIDIDYADNGAMVLLKCQSCRKRWARVFENPSEDARKDSFASWRKPLMVQHDLEHKNKKV